MESYLTFKLEDDLYAIHVVKLSNILEISQITQVPNSPEYLLGVSNFRGVVMPIVDLRIKLGLKQNPTTQNSCILVLEMENEGKTDYIGSLVDAVQEVIELNFDDILLPPVMTTGNESSYLTGMVKTRDEKFIMILDIDKIFKTDEIAELTMNNNN
mgnify:CR=1 FL=1